MVKVENYSDIPDIDQTLIQKMKAYLPTDKIKEVTAAYDFAEDAHSGQKRLSGEPFFEHPKQTALFLADLKLDANTISAALLHDVGKVGISDTILKNNNEIINNCKLIKTEDYFLYYTTEQKIEYRISCNFVNKIISDQEKYLIKSITDDSAIIIIKTYLII